MSTELSPFVSRSENKRLVHSSHLWRSEPLPTKDDTVLDLDGVLRLLLRRKGWIWKSALAFTALAGLVCLVMTPRYKAEANIEILKQEQGTITPAPTESSSSGGNQTQAEDALEFSLSQETQVSILQSETLGLQVIKELNLLNTEDYQYNPLIKTAETRREMGLPIEQAPLKRAYILKRWAKHLKVEAVAGTRLINVTYSDPDRYRAAQVVNRLLRDFVEYNFQVRYNAAAKAADWLGGQLTGVKSEVEASEKHLVDVEKGTGMYGTGADNENAHNIIVARLEQLNSQFVEAQSTRFAKEAVYNLAKSGDPELVAGLLGGTNQPGTATGGSTPTLLIALRQSEADLNGAFAEASTKYGADNPKLIQIRSKLDAVRAAIKVETDKMVGRARQEYMAAVAAEDAASKALDQQKGIASEMNQKSIEFAIAKHEADSAQNVYQNLLERFREAGALAGVRSSDINIVDPAVPPGEPASPKVPLFLAAGAFIGMIFGLGAALIRDSLDTSLRNPEDVESTTRLPVLGIIPRAAPWSKGKRKLQKSKRAEIIAGSLLPARNGTSPSAARGALSATDSVVMEAFRAVRTSLMLSRPDNPRKVFVITSPLPHEGKSFSSLHLATVLAQNGGSVLLVDADLRRGTLSRNIEMSSAQGLSSLLAGESHPGVYRPLEDVPGVTFLAAGASPPNPAESLGSNKMVKLMERWRREFDFVVIDSPPILPVTDAAVLSQAADGVIVVVRFAVSTRQAILRAVRTLMDARAECFGVLVNAVDVRSSEYQYYYGAYGAERYGTDRGGAEVIPALVKADSEEKS